jgi:hypothetical protein
MFLRGGDLPAYFYPTSPDLSGSRGKYIIISARRQVAAIPGILVVGLLVHQLAPAVIYLQVGGGAGQMGRKSIV